jgi:hypothetical protein
LPVRPLFGPSLAREFERGDVERMAVQAAHEAWQKNIKHEVDFALRGIGVGQVSDGGESEEDIEEAMTALLELVL